MTKPPAGYTPVPNSKNGGYRKREGPGYVYWYPNGKGRDSGTEQNPGKSNRMSGITFSAYDDNGVPEEHKLSKEQIVRLSGAPPGSQVAAKYDAGSWMIRTSSADVSLFRMIDMKKNEVRNMSMIITNTGNGLGAKIFYSQVESCIAMGIDRIRTDAVGSKYSGSHNGYYTWARLGYNAEIDTGMILRGLTEEIANSDEDDVPNISEVRKSFYERRGEFSRVSSLHELMSAPGGAEFWRDFGSTIRMTFDTSDGSESVRILREYMKSKS